MVRKPRRHLRVGTPQDLATRRRLYEDGLFIRVIAQQMGRPQNSVSCRVILEKMSRGGRRASNRPPA